MPVSWHIGSRFFFAIRAFSSMDLSIALARGAVSFSSAPFTALTTSFLNSRFAFRQRSFTASFIFETSISLIKFTCKFYPEKATKRSFRGILLPSPLIFRAHRRPDASARVEFTHHLCPPGPTCLRDIIQHLIHDVFVEYADIPEE